MAAPPSVSLYERTGIGSHIANGALVFAITLLSGFTYALALGLIITLALPDYMIQPEYSERPIDLVLPNAFWFTETTYMVCVAALVLAICAAKGNYPAARFLGRVLLSLACILVVSVLAGGLSLFWLPTEVFAIDEYYKIQFTGWTSRASDCLAVTAFVVSAVGMWRYRPSAIK